MLAATYTTNRIEPIGAEDTLPTELLPLAILRGDGPYIDRYEPLIQNATDGRLPWSMVRRKGHILSRYSIGTVIVNLPFIAPQLAVIDHVDPGWDKNPGLAYLRSQRMSKIAAGLIAALTGVILYRVLRRLGIGRMALPATLAASLGSELWTIASQAVWEHGAATLMLTLTMLLLTPRPLSRIRLLAGGTTAALMVCCRQIDVIFAVAFLVRVALERPRALAWFLPGPILLGSALVGYNYWFFQSIAGGHAELEALHPGLHGMQGIWSGDFIAGLTGTLFSPNRGLFVFSPWVVVALAMLPLVWDRVRGWSLGIVLALALVVDLLALSKYSVWWAGHTFGPRYWTDTMPIFAVFFGFGLDWAWSRSRRLTTLLFVPIIVAIAIQAVGAFCFPTTWNLAPADIDKHPERAWDWSDSELRRCLSEGLQQWTRYRDPFWQGRHR
ncbi:hypothetical protein [Singulisphaera sp. PoT]|uniref:hypothetical protein n=1 Tax=Singulisphaera sp. PoT TaxID=3411797 RepID=UPI003BF4A3DB